ncbi:MAG: sodium:proton antiporter [Magnetococcales bacterium]|nr:sodium:proton antiporter [Magnetococcales bacterium]
MAVPLLATVLFGVVFSLMLFSRLDRRLLMLAGGFLFVVLGYVLDFYSLKMAWNAIYFETLALIFGLSLISATLAKSGYFETVARRLTHYSNGDGWLILVLFALITYFFSLFVNNLAAMVVILPVTFQVCRSADLNPVPYVIAEIIASNLGGASTMMGDFPNMIISSAGHLHFLDFIGGMMVPTLILLALMLLYFQSRKREILPQPLAANRARLRPLSSAVLSDSTVDHARLRFGLLVLSLTLCGFLLAESMQVRPALVAMLAGFALLIWAPFRYQELFQVTGAGDVLFFLGLFVMVGGLQAAGVLDGISWLINEISGGEPVFELLALLWLAGLLTPFLNAGPATAFFIPIAQELNGFIPGDTVWWALSLGILAGSSASLSGATAGSVAASKLEEYLKEHSDMVRLMPAGRGLDFMEYFRWGQPILVLFLGFSSLYIFLIAP